MYASATLDGYVVVAINASMTGAKKRKKKRGCSRKCNGERLHVATHENREFADLSLLLCNSRNHRSDTLMRRILSFWTAG